MGREDGYVVSILPRLLDLTSIGHSDCRIDELLVAERRCTCRGWGNEL